MMAVESDFWASIGRPKYVVAPMVNQSELPFRMLCRRYGAQLTFTPMLHGRIFAENEKYRTMHFQTDPADVPLVAQVCGDDAAVLARAAAHLKGRVAAIDLNLGCPQGIAKDGHYGSFLLDEPDLVIGIVRRITEEVGIPVTCKIRKVDKNSLQSTLNFCYGLEVSMLRSVSREKLSQQSGCKALTFHGRHRTEKGHNIADADWEAIRIVKSRVGIPVIANGGIETFEDVKRCLEYTGADAVMSSEAILERPYLFSGKVYDNLDVFQEYLDIVKLYPNQPPCCIRGHAFKMLYQHCQKHHAIRDQLATSFSIDDFERVIENARRHLCDNKEGQEYTHASGSWYRRHRNPGGTGNKIISGSNYEDCVNEGLSRLFGG